MKGRAMHVACERAGVRARACACVRARGMQVDVIVSEWMGYSLLYETMFDSVQP
jgi:hypothetical protein